MGLLLGEGDENQVLPSLRLLDITLLSNTPEASVYPSTATHSDARERKDKLLIVAEKQDLLLPLLMVARA